jgi:hypothetical protein
MDGRRGKDRVNERQGRGGAGDRGALSVYESTPQLVHRRLLQGHISGNVEGRGKLDAGRSLQISEQGETRAVRLYMYSVSRSTGRASQCWYGEGNRSTLEKKKRFGFRAIDVVPK